MQCYSAIAFSVAFIFVLFLGFLLIPVLWMVALTREKKCPLIAGVFFGPTRQVSSWLDIFF